MPILALLALLVGLAGPASAQAPGVSRPEARVSAGPQQTSRIEVELVPMNRWAAPGSTAIVALRQKIQPGWHTYWRNPGDSGGPTSLDWRLPPGIVAEDIVWPLPTRQRLADLVNLGYEGRVLLPVPIEVPVDTRPGSVLPLIADAHLFVCSDEMCVPETLTVRLDLPIREGAAPLSAPYGSDIQRLVETAPRPAGVTARFDRVGDRIVLSAAGGPLAGGSLNRATFFPFDAGRVSHGPALSAEAGAEGVTLTLDAADVAAAAAGPLTGVLATDAGAWEVSARPGAALAGTAGRRLAVSDAADGATELGRLWRAVVLAFLGGLILNLMPCVFPVLALKAAALSRSAGEPSRARIDGLAYAMGVMISFGLLGGAMLALRGAGQEIGWGFQLQSPAVVGALALVMLAVGLNLAGVFEIGGRLQAVGASRPARLGGVSGAFFTGVLAVVVAAPCTAPFMAAALGAALVAPWPVAMGIFLALGAGLALPYLAISLSPWLLRRLPRPGPWMATLQRVLAVPMFGAALWLAWVFQRQQGWSAATLLAAGLIALGAAIWLYGRAQRRRFEARPGGRLRFGATACVAVAATCLAVGATLPPPKVASPAMMVSAPWSPEAVRAAQADGRPVLVDFTADWCVSCKINERTALSARETREALARTRAVYLVADWTRRDPAIARELAAHGRSGVPLYLVYGPADAEPRILPQLLSSGTVIEALEDAAS